MSAFSNAGSSSGSSSRMPAHRASFHQRPPRAPHHPTCRCTQCYLRPSLFPRDDRGVILLPTPSWLYRSSGPGSSDERAKRARGESVTIDSRTKGKGKEITSPRVRSHSLKLEGPGQPRSPTWYNRIAAAGHSEHGNVLPSPTISGNPHSNSDSLSLPQLQSPQNLNVPGKSSAAVPATVCLNSTIWIIGPSQPRPQLPTIIELERAPLPPYSHEDPPPQRPGKRKLSELSDTLDPAEHVLDFRNPPPPQGREPLRGFPRQRAFRAEPAYSRRGTPDSHVQSYRSHVPENTGSGSSLIMDRNMEMAIGPSRPRAYSEASSSKLPPQGASHRPGGSSSSDDYQGRWSPTAEGSSRQNRQSELHTPIPRELIQPSSSFLSDDASNSQPEGESEANSEAVASGSGSARSAGNPIRFREPLTAGSRQDRRVVKGGVAVIQVKWDSDRKRRQGYFAPDTGSEKSKFRHYSKDDCCFDE